MSEGLDILFHLETPVSDPGDLLCQMVDAAVRCARVDGEVEDLKATAFISKDGCTDYEGVFEREGRLTPEAVRGAIVRFQKGYDGVADPAWPWPRELGNKRLAPSRLSWSVRITCRCGLRPDRSHARAFGLRLSAVGKSHRPQSWSTRAPHPYASGDADLWSYQLGGFLGEGPEIEENYEALLDLLPSLIQATSPVAVRAFRESQLRVAVNAGMAYYRDLSACVEEIRYLAYACSKEPLENWGASTFREGGRSREKAESLVRELGHLLPLADQVGIEHVEAALKSGVVESYPLGPGVVILDYPCFMSRALDAFFLDVLRRAAPAASPPSSEFRG